MTGVREGAAAVPTVAAGYNHTLALRADGTVLAWGDNRFGQLGDGTLSPRSCPAEVPGLSGIVAIAAGANHNLALRDDGTVLAWGDSRPVRPGDGIGGLQTRPVPVAGLSEVVVVATGPGLSAAVRRDGTLWVWRSNMAGVLSGVLTQNIPTSPTPFPGLTGVASVAIARQHAIALMQDGTLRAWGSNMSGELGNDTKSSSPIPVQVADLTGVTAIAVGEDYSAALKQDGSVWTWGNNYAGQLGGGGPGPEARRPIRVQGLARVKRLAAGLRLTAAVTEAGGVWVWGGMVLFGSGTTIRKPFPALVAGSDDAQAVAVSNLSLVALANNDFYRVWGMGSGCIEGAAGWSFGTRPLPVSGLSGISGIRAGGNVTFASGPDAAVWAWGNNQSAQLRDDPKAIAYLPPSPWPQPGVLEISASPSSTGIVTPDGKAWIRGGDRKVDRQLSQIPSLDGVRALAVGANHRLALTGDGMVYAWGVNDRGQLGGGSLATHREVPAPVPGLTDVIAIAAGANHSLAITRDGSLWVWGRTNIARVERGPEITATPVRVPALPRITAISTNNEHTLALAGDGTVWEWGAGRTGIGPDGLRRDAPSAMVEGLAGVKSVAAGEEHALALLGDGTVLAWGRNLSGQLGDPSAEGMKPAPVPGLKGVRAIAAGNSHSVALLEDGTVFTWGNNAGGELGLPLVPFAEKLLALGRTETLATLPTIAVPAAPAPADVAGARPSVQAAEIPPFTIQMASGTKRLSSIAFDKDGRRAAVTVAERPKVAIFDLTKGMPVQSLPLKAGGGTGVAFCPDGKTLAAGNASVGVPSTNKLFGVKDPAAIVTLQLFDLASGVESALLEMPKPMPCLGGSAVNSVHFSADGSRLFAGASGVNCGQIGAWDLVTRLPLWSRTSRATLTAMALSPDANFLAMGGGTEFDKPVEIITSDRGKLAASLAPALYGTVRAVAFSPRGDLLAVVRSTETYRPPTGTESVVGGIELWRTSNWQLQETIPVPWKDDGGRARWVRSISFSPDGALLALCGRTDEIEILNLATKERNIIPRRASFLSFSPDGKHLAALTETDFSILILPGR